MTIVMAWIQTYWRELVLGTFGGMQVVSLMILLVISHRTAVVQKKIDRVVANVEEYLQAVLQEDEEPKEEKAVPVVEKRQEEEEENRLISAVLREIFP
ncbi:MAG: hypothetical protein PUA77_02195 [Lachnospiraceae bacterium]|nr:hypothetical protein [Agathobacter sp.]MDD6290592.1 hypothetical protein [Lachnospiraceae bacterium]